MNPPEKDDLVEIIEHFGCRLFHVFAYFFFSVEFKKDEKFLNEVLKKPSGDIIRELRLGTIQAACSNTTLLAIRDVHEFFHSDKKRRDDVKASDLGYNEGLEFLTKDELKRINKEIMHSTISAVKNYDASWDIQELAFKCISQSLHFLNWVKENHQSSNQVKVCATAIKYIKLTKMIGLYAEKFDTKSKN